MALVVRAMVLLMVMAAVEVSYAAVYKVGDSAGWTTLGNIDYRKWSATKNFQIGDTISKSSDSNCCMLVFLHVSILVFQKGDYLLFKMKRRRANNTILTLFYNSMLSSKTQLPIWC